MDIWDMTLKQDLMDALDNIEIEYDENSTISEFITIIENIPSRINLDIKNEALSIKTISPEDEPIIKTEKLAHNIHARLFNTLRRMGCIGPININGTNKLLHHQLTVKELIQFIQLIQKTRPAKMEYNIPEETNIKIGEAVEFNITLKDEETDEPIVGETVYLICDNQIIMSQATNKFGKASFLQRQYNEQTSIYQIVSKNSSTGYYDTESDKFTVTWTKITPKLNITIPADIQAGTSFNIETQIQTESGANIDTNKGEIQITIQGKSNTYGDSITKETITTYTLTPLHGYILKEDISCIPISDGNINNQDCTAIITWTGNETYEEITKIINFTIRKWESNITFNTYHILDNEENLIGENTLPTNLLINQENGTNSIDRHTHKYYIEPTTYAGTITILRQIIVDENTEEHIITPNNNKYYINNQNETIEGVTEKIIIHSSGNDMYLGKTLEYTINIYNKKQPYVQYISTYNPYDDETLITENLSNVSQELTNLWRNENITYKIGLNEDIGKMNISGTLISANNANNDTEMSASKNKGTYSIIVQRDADDEYYSVNETISVPIKDLTQKSQTTSISIKSGNNTEVYSGQSITIKLNYNGTTSCSSNGGCTVSGSGGTYTVTYSGTGTKSVTFKASKSAYDDHTGHIAYSSSQSTVTATCIFKANKTNNPFTLSTSSVNWGKATTLNYSNTGGATITPTSINPSSDKIGTYTFSASSTETDDYKATTKNVSVTVKKNNIKITQSSITVNNGGTGGYTSSFTLKDTFNGQYVAGAHVSVTVNNTTVASDVISDSSGIVRWTNHWTNQSGTYTLKATITNSDKWTGSATTSVTIQ